MGRYPCFFDLTRLSAAATNSSSGNNDEVQLRVLEQGLVRNHYRKMINHKIGHYRGKLANFQNDCLHTINAFFFLKLLNYSLGK